MIKWSKVVFLFFRLPAYKIHFAGPEPSTKQSLAQLRPSRVHHSPWRWPEWRRWGVPPGGCCSFLRCTRRLCRHLCSQHWKYCTSLQRTRRGLWKQVINALPGNEVTKSQPLLWSGRFSTMECESWDHHTQGKFRRLAWWLRQQDRSVVAATLF